MLVFGRQIIFSNLLVMLLLFLMINSVSAQNIVRDEKYEWEKIIPLVTKKSEIEKLYGKSIFDFENGVSFVYQTKFGKLGIRYKGKNDLTNNLCKWKIEPDTVISYRVSLSENILVSKFKYDSNLFEKEFGHEGDFSYGNNEIGLTFFGYFSDTKEEWISTIYYYPTLADEKSKCKK